jgi:hypothetical protein
MQSDMGKELWASLATHKVWGTLDIQSTREWLKVLGPGTGEFTFPRARGDVREYARECVRKVMRDHYDKPIDDGWLFFIRDDYRYRGGYVVSVEMPV